MHSNHSLTLRRRILLLCCCGSACPPAVYRSLRSLLPIVLCSTSAGIGSVPGRNFIQILNEDGLWVCSFSEFISNSTHALSQMTEQAQKGNFTVTFPQEDSSIEFPNTDAGLVSYFSGWGPNADMLFKPAISAPGGQILSTMPVNMGSWAVMSGTIAMWSLQEVIHSAKHIRHIDGNSLRRGSCCATARSQRQRCRAGAPVTSTDDLKRRSKLERRQRSS